MNKNVDLNKYKGAIIQYECTDTSNCFFEDFQSQISKIKSENCSHFNFKFIYVLEGGKFNYNISFNCKHCGTNEIKNLYDDKTKISNNIEYKCSNCGNGNMKIGLLLSEEVLDLEENDNTSDSKVNENKNINNNIIKNDNKMNNINNYGQMNNQNLMGGNIRQNNIQGQMNNIISNNMINNMMNNMMFNNMFFKNNMMNNNLINNMILQNNLMNNNIMNNNMMNNNLKANEIKIFFEDMKGLRYERIVSLDSTFSEVVRNLLNDNKNIDKEKISSFVCNGARVVNHKTIRQNDIKNGNKIIMYFKVE